MNKTAIRRIKLFDDAKHYGAEIIKTENWTCAVCRTYDQAHCFGRGKPKVIPGTNEIDQDANLRDDEGISADKKQLRDSDAQWVRDGISPEMDSQPFEAGWCVMGGNPMYEGSTLAWGPNLKPCHSYSGISVYCNGAKPNEVCPLIVFLEHNTGKLYISNLQYSKYGMMQLSGGWCVSDFNCEINGYTEGGIRRRITSDPEFAEIYQIAADKSLEGMSGATPIDVIMSARTRVVRNAFGNEMTVLSLYKTMVRADCTSGMSMYMQTNGNLYPITKIIEGVGSSVVFVAIAGKRAIRISEFLDYARKHTVDDASFKMRKVEIKHGGAMLGLSADIHVNANKCILVANNT